MDEGIAPAGRQGPGTIAWGRGHVRHARVPEWVLDAEINDRAVRLYAVLGRYADEQGTSKVSKAKLMTRLRCTRPTLDVAFRDLTGIGALEIIPRTRDDGSTAPNEYLLNWTPPPSECVDSFPPPVSELEGPPVSTLTGSRARQDGGKPFESKSGTKEANASPEDAIPALRLIEGRNIALDELCSATGVDPAGPRMSQAVAALNGRSKGKYREEGIRDLFWLEAERWAEEHDRPDALVDLRDRFEEALVQAIRVKAEKYRREMPDAALTPTALRNWWLDLELQRSRSGGLTADEIEAMG